MAVSVSRDLSVSVTRDVNAVKLTEQQRALRESVQKGEPKALGVSQIVLGVMIMSYSIPLLSTEMTEVMTFGVPWWSGVSFIAAGVVAIVMEKHTSIKTLGVCMYVMVVSVGVSVLAVVVYCVDLHLHPPVPCITNIHTFRKCDDQHYTTALSRAVKGCLLLFTIIQTSLSTALAAILFLKRRGFGQYTSLTAPLTPTTLSAPEFD